MKMEQLYREQVERQIAEMWAALADAPRDEFYDAAHQQAAEVARRLREQLTHDERVREAAPELLAALEELSAVTQRALSGDYDDDDTRDALDDARAAIAKATGGQ